MTLNDLECTIHLKVRLVDVRLLRVSDSTTRIGVARGGGGSGLEGLVPPPCGQLTRCFSAVAELLVLYGLTLVYVGPAIAACSRTRPCTAGDRLAQFKAAAYTIPPLYVVRTSPPCTQSLTAMQFTDGSMRSLRWRAPIVRRRDRRTRQWHSGVIGAMVLR